MVTEVYFSKTKMHNIIVKLCVISPAEKATVAVTNSRNSLNPGVTEVRNTFQSIGQAEDTHTHLSALLSVHSECYMAKRRVRELMENMTALPATTAQ